MKFLQFGSRKRCGAAARADLRAEQRFVGVNVADAAEQLLIQQRALDRRLAFVEERDEVFEVDVQRLEARSAEAAVSARRQAHNGEAAEAAIVDEAQFASGLRASAPRACASGSPLPAGRSATGRSCRGGRSTGLPGLGTRETRRTRSLLRRRFSVQPVLGRSRSKTMCLPTRRTCVDARVFEDGRDFGGGRFERLGLFAEPDGFDGVARDALVQAAGNGFYLGKFGHRKLV